MPIPRTGLVTEPLRPHLHYACMVYTELQGVGAKHGLWTLDWTHGLECGLRFGPTFGLQCACSSSLASTLPLDLSLHVSWLINLVPSSFPLTQNQSQRY